MNNKVIQWGGSMVACSILLMLLFITGIFDSIIRPFQGIIEAPISIFSSGARFFRETIRAAAATPFTIEEMQKTITQLRTENESYKNLKLENDALRKQLLFKEKTKYSVMQAHVIGMSSESGSNLMIIDKGSDDGIRSQSAVIADDGVFIGRIITVKSTLSFVLLPNNDKSNVIASIVKNDVELSGIVHGSFRTGLVLDRVEQKIPLAQGDILTTSALNNTIPSGLLIGTVREVISTANDLFQQSIITPAKQYEAVRIVGVIVN